MAGIAKAITTLPLPTQVAFLLLAVVYLVCQSAITINAIPVDNDSAELIMKIEKVNERLPGNESDEKIREKTQPEGRFSTK